MARKKSSKLNEGTGVRVREGVQMPEFSEVEISGWTATIVEARGRGADLKYFVEWDDATLQNMPESYREHCESQGLYHGMACLAAAEVEPIDEIE